MGGVKNGGIAGMVREHVDPRLDALIQSMDENKRELARVAEALEFRAEYDDLVRRSDTQVITGNPAKISIVGPPPGTIWLIDTIGIYYAAGVAAGVPVSVFHGPAPTDATAAAAGSASGQLIGAGAVGTFLQSIAFSYNQMPVNSDITAVMTGGSAAGTVTISIMGRALNE